MRDAKYSFKDFLTCPYCSFQQNQANELSDEYGETECESCGEEFIYERHVCIYYSSKEIVDTPSGEKESKK